ncbi:unnamed protein product, partial [Discosporangium mesarthrocarpum]
MGEGSSDCTAIVQLLVQLHSFRNVDLCSKGLFCVEVSVYPLSAPDKPAVPYRTFCEAFSRQSVARGVTVTPLPTDVDWPGMAGTNANGRPSYASSLLPIRFTHEMVKLNEGVCFRCKIDADGLDADIVVVELRLLTAELPEMGGSHVARLVEESGVVGKPSPPPTGLPCVGKMAFLHVKCGSAKGGLHRYHPVIFSPPWLCLVDMTMHMALTSITHPRGASGLASAISSSAFPTNENPRGSGGLLARAGSVMTPGRKPRRKNPPVSPGTSIAGGS